MLSWLPRLLSLNEYLWVAKQWAALVCKPLAFALSARPRLAVGLISNRILELVLKRRLSLKPYIVEFWKFSSKSIGKVPLLFSAGRPFSKRLGLVLCSARAS